LVLQQYIQEILFRQHICCLPQLGVFRLTHTPARYDVTSKTILPPGEIITFDETLTNDGGLLEWISQKEHLVPAIAQLKMEKYLDDFRKVLKNGEAIVIPGVGQLQANNVGRISFDQEPPALTRDVLHVSPVIRQDAIHKVTVGNREMVGKQVVDHLTASPSSSSSSSSSSSAPAPTPAPEPVATTPSTPASTVTTGNTGTTGTASNDYEYEYAQEIPSKLRWLWVAIPVACVVTAGIVWYSVNKNRPQITRAESALNPAPVEAAPVAASQAKADSAEKAAATAAAAANAQEMAYDVIFATYKTRKGADDMFKKQSSWQKDKPVKFVLLANADSSSFMVAEQFNTPAADTTAVKDSIQQKYKPKFKVFIQPSKQ
jgi:nucleoid DNA-binding protein